MKDTSSRKEKLPTIEENQKRIESMIDSQEVLSLKMKNEVESIIGTNRQFVKEICDSLNQPSDKYEIKTTLEPIIKYLKSDQRLSRILYSEISSNIFEIQKASQKEDSISTNLDRLITEVIAVSDEFQKIIDQEESVEIEAVKEFVVKLFDHIHLAELQINLIKEAQKSGDEAKKTTKRYEQKVGSLSKKLQNAQKEYVTILGILATIIVTFMGSMSFSSSVLQAMNSSSIYRLVGVIVLLGFVIFNLLGLLMKFLLIITDKLTTRELGKKTFGIRFWKWKGFTFTEKINFIFFILFLFDCLLRLVSYKFNLLDSIFKLLGVG